MHTAASRRPGDISALAAQGAQDAYNRVVVCGGDGSVREAAQGLAGSGVPLAIIPLGTANVLAREIGLPVKRTLECARQAGRGLAKSVTLGLVNGKSVFTFCASAGLDSMAVSHIDLKMKRETGAWAYLYAGLLSSISGELPDLEIHVPGRKAVSAWQVWLTNGRYYGGGLQLSPSGSLFVGTLKLIVLQRRFGGGIPSALCSLLSGRGLEGGKGVISLDAHHVEITSNLPSPLQLDGDVLHHTPVTITAKPEAVQVIFPSGPGT